MGIFEEARGRLKRLAELEGLLQDPAVSRDPKRSRGLGRELRDLRRLREAFERARTAQSHLKETEHLAADPGTDPDLLRMAESESRELRARLDGARSEMDRLLHPPDPKLEKNVLVEVRAGTGGLEASLFASDIFRMYSRYAASKNYDLEVLSQSVTEAGGIREVIFLVEGPGAFGRFQHESGVHRVQRVPVTEASGRIHTSTVTVAVLPEAEELDVDIRPEELRIDVFRSGGPGGQSVNTTDSAVRVTHLPTGLVVKCQDEKSQIKNKQKALKILRARLLDVTEREAHAKAAEARRRQVGSGERSEKIRTYNFSERRVTDHRIGLTLHNLEAVLDGGLDPFIDALSRSAL